MANPFLKIDSRSGYQAPTEEIEEVEIDEATGEPMAEPAAGVPAPLGPNEIETEAPNMVSSDNPFVDPAAQPVNLDAAQFGVAFYDKLKNDEKFPTPGELIEWSKQVGQEILPDDAFYQVYRDAKAAREQGKPVPNARIDEISRADAESQGFTLSDAGTVLRNMGQAIPFSDEIYSAAKATPKLITGGTDAFNKSYLENWKELNTMNDLDQETRAGLSTLGLGLGIVGTLMIPGPAAATRLKAVKDLGRMKAAGAAPAEIAAAREAIIRSLGKDMAIGAGVGGATGAIYGTGEGTPDDRFGKTAESAGIGAGVGLVTPAAIVAGERVTRPIRERVAPLVDSLREKIATIAPRVAPSSSSSVRALERRVDLKPEEMRANAERARELGTDPALFDVVPEQGRNVIGKAGQRDETRETFQEFARGREVALPENVQKQAGRISSDPRTPTQLRDGLTEYRDTEIDLALKPIRGLELPVTDEVTQILATREGQRAINQAIGMETDPAIRANFEALRTAAKQMNKIDPRLPERARQQVMRQIMMDAKFDINASDKISRALRRQAESGGSDARTLYQFANTIRDAARAEPRYVTAMEGYGAQSKAAKAIDVGGGGTNSGGYLNEPAEGFVDEFGTLSDKSTARLATPRREGEGDLEFIAGREEPVTNPGGEVRRNTQPEWGPTAFDDLSDETLFQDLADNAGQSGQTDISRELQRRGYSTDQVLDVDSGDRTIRQILDEGPSYGEFADDPMRAATASGISPDTERDIYAAALDADTGMGLDMFDLEDVAYVARTTNNDEVAEILEQRLYEQLGPDGASDMLRGVSGNKPTNKLPTVEFKPEEPNPGTLNRRNVRYTLPDGRTVTGEISWLTGKDEAIVEVYGMGNWTGRSNQFGPDMMRDIGAAINEQYPQLKFLTGSRATGASQGPAASGRGATQKVRVDPSKSAPSEQRLARVGAADQVRREAGKGVPQAASVANRIAISPEMRRKSTAMMGEEGANNLAAAMDEELRRVRNANAQATNQGASRGGDTMEGTESAVNALYNPQSPITWGREAMRFLNKVGMTEKDARFIIDNATDPTKTDQLIDQLEKAGLDRLRAKAYVDVLRNGLTRYATTSEEN